MNARPNRSRDAAGLVSWLALSALAIWAGSALTRPSIPTWYAALQKPAWTPPNWVFGPVWTVIFILMAVAAWLVWRKQGFLGARLALGLYLGQLALNVAWSWLFFYSQNPAAGFVDIVLLWLMIAGTLAAFLRHSRWAAGMLAPYLLWVGYAGGLNFAIWRLNS